MVMVRVRVRVGVRVRVRRKGVDTQHTCSWRRMV